MYWFLLNINSIKENCLLLYYKNIVIVRILSRLGNQMFQYAYGKAMELKGFKVRIDISSYQKYKLHCGYQLDKYNID